MDKKNMMDKLDQIGKECENYLNQIKENQQE